MGREKQEPQQEEEEVKGERRGLALSQLKLQQAPVLGMALLLLLVPAGRGERRRREPLWAQKLEQKPELGPLEPGLDPRL